MADPPTRDGIEVLQEAPNATGASVAAALLTAVFFAAIAWLALRVIGSLLHAAAAVVVCALLVWIPARMQRARVLRARRVVSDREARQIRVERRGGTEVIAWDDIAAVTSEPVLLSDGISLDAVTIARKSGASLSFSALDRATADGIARSVRAVVGLETPRPTD